MPEYELVIYRGVWSLYWREDSAPRRRSLGTADKGEALALKAEIERLDAAATGPHLTVEAIWSEYGRYLNGRPAARRMPSVWRALAPTFGGLLPANITRDLCGEYIAVRRAGGRKDGTILTELNQLGSALHWKLGAAAPRLAYPPRPAPRSRHLTKEQVQRLLECCRYPHLRVFIVLAITTGARMGAILDLTWDRVDFDRGRIDLRLLEPGRQMKGRAVVPMNGTARAALLQARERARTPYVVEWGGHRVGSVKKALSRLGAAAGVPGVSAHVFRHSAAVWMAEAGTLMSEIAQYLGHESTRETERVYARFSPAYLARAASALEL